MADESANPSTSDYLLGYDLETEERLSRRSAARDAAYLLPHLKPGMRMLDVGCGPGSISAGLAEAVDPGEFYGIDMAESQVQRSAAVAAEAGLLNARFQVADAARLPFPDNHFDAAHCHAFLMHVPGTLVVLSEILRVLKPGGFLGAREPILDSFFIEPDMGNLQQVWPVYVAVLTSKGGHPQIGRELRARFGEAGFVDIRTSGSVESWVPSSGSPTATGSDTFENHFIGPDTAEPAVAHGFATQADIFQWREAFELWKREPGAVGGFVLGEAIGRKP